MKNEDKWQVQYNFKKHKEKIKNVKSSIPQAQKIKVLSSARKSTNKDNEIIELEMLETLKHYNLQQYKNQLEKLGFFDNIAPLLLPHNLDKVLENVKFISGHKQRFKDMIMDLKVLNYIQE